jgi:NADH-quinone oxidoreductase subunit G
VIVGQAALRREDGAAILAAVSDHVARYGAGLLILHTAASRVGAMDVGAVTEGGLDAALDAAETVFALGVDEIDIPDGPFVVYQGSHGDRGAHRADVILPAACYTEENATFVNTEGRPQLAIRANFAPGEAKENWAILRALSGEIGSVLPYDSLRELRSRMWAAVPHLKGIDQVPRNDLGRLEAEDIGEGELGRAVEDHYLVNAICRASPLMAELSRKAKGPDQAPLAAE